MALRMVDWISVAVRGLVGMLGAGSGWARALRGPNGGSMGNRAVICLVVVWPGMEMCVWCAKGLALIGLYQVHIEYSTRFYSTSLNNTK